ncbi:DUF6241 domain-containing protein [Peribacillus alkalitolerans]|uniref:DUF6241 domain-containing protein n=1 Tax=Peribacillus alkalitolerans TaxID=1550385 RepID=UPI0013D7FE8E|nr:DUF6241 domain-containing protein [Peribacillus alkalitolerans]
MAKFKINKVQYIGLGLLCITILSYSFWSTGYLSIPQLDKVTDLKQSQSRQVYNESKSQYVVEELPINMEEFEVQIAMHHMSHQKVKADKKWGALQITPERINRLIEIVTKNQKGYDHSSTYLDILNRWNEGDFSRVDRDHNEIWRLQGGTIGKATGILSAKKEKKYIEENFE